MNLYSNERKTKEIVEKYFSVSLFKTDKYHPFDYRDCSKDYYVIYNKNISFGAHKQVYIEMSKIDIANISDKDVYFIFAFDDGVYMYTHNRNKKCILQLPNTNELKNYCWIDAVKLNRLDISLECKALDTELGDLSMDDDSD